MRVALAALVVALVGCGAGGRIEAAKPGFDVVTPCITSVCKGTPPPEASVHWPIGLEKYHALYPGPPSKQCGPNVHEPCYVVMTEGTPPPYDFAATPPQPDELDCLLRVVKHNHPTPTVQQFYELLFLDGLVTASGHRVFLCRGKSARL